MAASQFRCKGFEVQSALVDSDDAFQTLPDSFVPGAGTTAGSRKYSFVDGSASGAQYYRLRISDTSDAVSYSRSSKVPRITGITDAILPWSFALEQNYPNPFNPLTSIKYTIAGSGGPGVSDVKLTVYDLLGREVAVLVNDRKLHGSYQATFDGSGLASGMYIYRLKVGAFVESRTMLLLR